MWTAVNALRRSTVRSTKTKEGKGARVAVADRTEVPRENLDYWWAMVPSGTF
jgi:hypothetical protein